MLQTRDNRPALMVKLARLSPGLREMITFDDDERPFVRVTKDGRVSAYLLATLRHCNGGRTAQAGLTLKEHCDRGGKLFITMAGAGSSFQMGIMLSELIRAGKVAAISVTGANLEESLYRLIAHSAYAHIRDYAKLTRAQELELDHTGLRRITDTFLPEEESVRVVWEPLLGLWRQAAAQGTPRHWHEFFFLLFERELITRDVRARLEDCWLYQAWKHGVHVCVPGWEDSTMGNLFAHATYHGDHPFLARYKLTQPVPMSAVCRSFEYMHALAEWYMDTARQTPLAFLQLGGGVAADFPICVVPHLKKDYLADVPVAQQEEQVPAWAVFIEIHLAPMSAGSYSGAGGDEKITWGKVRPDTYTAQIFADYTTVFPLLAAIILDF